MSLASPREAAPGPGYWTVTDLDSRLTVNRGRLYVSGSSAAYDRTMLYLQTPFARAKGRYVEFGVTPDDAAHAMKLGWQNAASAAEANQEAGLLFDSDGFVKAIDGTGNPVNVRYPYAGGTSYVCRVYDGGSPVAKVNPGGDFYAYIRTSAEENWTLLWRKTSSAAPLTQLYAGINNLSLTGYLDFVRIRHAQLLPVWGYVALPVSGQLICQEPDSIVELLVETPDTGTVTMTFRGDGGVNFWSLKMDVDNAELSLSKTVLGAITRVQSRAVAFRPGRMYLLRAVMFGSSIRTFAGRTEGPYTDDSFQSEGVAAGVSASAATTNMFNLRADASGDLLW